MRKIAEVTAAWAAWVAKAAPDVLDTITHVQLNQKAGGYEIHITAWDANQLVVDHLASAIGCPTDEGWQPKSGNTKRQWSLSVIRGGFDWHVTATEDWAPGERPDQEETADA